jgi:hypothetical protein
MTSRKMIHDQPQDDESPFIICQGDFENAFQMPPRQLSAGDCILGWASRTYDDGRVQIGDNLPHLPAPQHFFPYFRYKKAEASRNRFTDHEETTNYVEGSRGGQQGDPLEMTRFCQTVHLGSHTH